MRFKRMKARTQKDLEAGDGLTDPAGTREAGKLARGGGAEVVSELLRRAEAETAAARHNDALGLLTQARTLSESCDSQALKGASRHALARTLEALAAAENRPDYTEKALAEFADAASHFERAGQTPSQARAEFDTGLLLARVGRHHEARSHFERARRLFVGLGDARSAARVDDALARSLLARGRNYEAERLARGPVNTFERAGAWAFLAEALTTHGMALARLGRAAEAEAAFGRAMKAAGLEGDPHAAGRAALALIEELAERLEPDRLRAAYERADALLADSKQTETLARLRACARRLLAAHPQPAAAGEAGSFVHASEQTARLLEYARGVAATASPVLITGETGTGKEVLARLIHRWSGRRGKFVAVNCATLSPALFESQLFGHRRGSFTDACENHAGAVSEAVGGTLFLDEVGELGAQQQAKFLRLIDGGEVHALGATAPERLDVRVVAATNHDIREDLRRGLFRPDLFYRLASFVVEIPPLRERPDDIAALARHFIREASRRHAKHVSFTPEAVEAMRRLPLKGNARELRSLIERTFLTAGEGAEIAARAVEALSLRLTYKAGLADAWADCSLDEEVRLFEGHIIKEALKAARGSVTCAARLLGISHQALSYILNARQRELLPARHPARRRAKGVRVTVKVGRAE